MLVIFAGVASGVVVHVGPPEPIVSADRAGMRNEPFDVDGDGVVDFLIENDGFSVSLVPFESNALSTWTGKVIGRAVPEGVFIGADPDLPFDWVGGFDVSPNLRLGPDVHACSGGFCVGDFSALGGFLGLEFDIGGETHYGWARLQGDPFFVRLEVQEWAYETVPGRPIASGAVPEPGGATLVVLAASLSALRRRR